MAVIIHVREGKLFTHEARVDGEVVSMCSLAHRAKGTEHCPCGMFLVVWNS